MTEGIEAVPKQTSSGRDAVNPQEARSVISHLLFLRLVVLAGLEGADIVAHDEGLKKGKAGAGFLELGLFHAHILPNRRTDSIRRARSAALYRFLCVATRFVFRRGLY